MNDEKPSGSQMSMDTFELETGRSLAGCTVELWELLGALHYQPLQLQHEITHQMRLFVRRGTGTDLIQVPSSPYLLVLGISCHFYWEILPLGAGSTSYSLRARLGTWLALRRGKGPGDANTGQRTEAVCERFESSPPHPLCMYIDTLCHPGG